MLHKCRHLVISHIMLKSLPFLFFLTLPGSPPSLLSTPSKPKMNPSIVFCVFI